MSKTLDAAAAAGFDDDVKHDYQGMGGISRKGTVTRRENVRTNPYSFRALGKGLAQPRGAPQTDITAMDLAHSKIPVTLENWVAPEYTDLFDQAQVNFDERAELAEAIAGAIGRRDDQLIIDAMDVSPAYAGTVTTAVGGAATGLNPAKLRRASRFLNSNGVPNSDRHLAVTAESVEDLLSNTEATSADFNVVKTLVNGEINSFVGFQFHMIEERVGAEGGLSKAGNVRDSFAWHTKSMGYANALFSTEVNYVPVKTSWLANGILKSGSVVRDTAGIVKVQTEETP